MSSSQVSKKAKDTMKSVKENLERAKTTTQNAIGRATPVMAKSLDSTMETASNVLSKTAKTIDSATASDQARLYRAYRKLLMGQVEFVDQRVKALESKTQAKE